MSSLNVLKSSRLSLRWPQWKEGVSPTAWLVVLTALAMASEPVFQPGVFADYGLMQIVAVVGRGFIGGLAILVAQVAAVWGVRRFRFSNAWIGSAGLIAAVGTATLVTSLGLSLFYFGSASSAWLPFAVGETLRWALIGSFLAIVDTSRRRRLRAAERAREVQLASVSLAAQVELAQQQCLEAQVEPHFLFNTVANLRRTWALDVALGQRMHDNLLHYLQAALPTMRAGRAKLGSEVALAVAYLELFSLRMGRRLAFSIDVPDALIDRPFPRMMLITLVENALRHGLMPSEHGGSVRIVARDFDGLRVAVCDDGVGFGATNTHGSGIGLANIRARLDTEFGTSAQLCIEHAKPPALSGVEASIQLPASSSVPKDAANRLQVSGGDGDFDDRPFDLSLALQDGIVERADVRACGRRTGSSPLSNWRIVASRTAGILVAGLLAQVPSILLLIRPDRWRDLLLPIFDEVIDYGVIAFSVALTLEAHARVLHWKPRWRLALLGLGVAAGVGAASAFVVERVALYPDAAARARLAQDGILSDESVVERHYLWIDAILASLSITYLLTRQHSAQVQARMNLLESAHQLAQRRLRETRDATHGARLDPQVLFDSLHLARTEYMRGQAQGDALLDRLIDLLRDALSRTRTDALTHASAWSRLAGAGHGAADPARIPPPEADHVA